ncbi:hypothetical protein CLV24_12165 [Pontibacter ummariensis]|uniref:Uncharacterized protein n=1 Tax=Pontibacter ummariensis TaxID=1610492 RepID=A0A239JDR4_9BACT|nr:hypothetical protein [Pontibacter ummariensis]PRY08378.1 hypothetical protein CLV24_12165 [Pontibacter ummariensis]SNT03985.1 hypothetical protein SAMN06296052_12165 [Pontibacter ummariensis]
MNELISKISSYNIFNFLFPGALFAVLADKLTRLSLLQEDMLIGAFVYYFIGLVISRFGSLVIEPVLKNIKFLEFSDYRDYISASERDQKIELCLEVSNTYRTITSMFIILGLVMAYLEFESKLHWLEQNRIHLLIMALLVMFAFSYRKQSVYLSKRVEANKHDKSKINK